MTVVKRIVLKPEIQQQRAAAVRFAITEVGRLCELLAVMGAAVVGLEEVAKHAELHTIGQSLDRIGEQIRGQRETVRDLEHLLQRQLSQGAHGV